MRLLLLLALLLLPAAFAWGGREHEAMCTRIAGRLDMPAAFAEGCRYPDIKGDFQNHICHEDWCPAKRKMQIHLEAGRNLMLEGKSPALQFGIACHYIADSLQPYHASPSSSSHLEFEGIRVDFREPMETNATLDQLNSNARNALAAIPDANVSLIASEFANKAMDLCYTMILQEMKKKKPAEVPDCSSVEKIMRNDGCHLRDVAVSGRIESPLRRTSRAGNEYTVFYLTDGRNRIRVFMFGSPELNDGALADIEGAYYLERKTGSYWFYNEIDASSVKEQNIFPVTGVVILLLFVAIVSIVANKAWNRSKR